MRRWSVVVMAVAAFVGIVGLASPAAAATIDAGAEGEFLALHQQARASAGLAGLADDALAREVARDWSRQLADSGALRHNPNLVDEIDRRVTTEWTRLGENVGRGPDARRTFDAFMASSGHRANILGDYNRIGIGATRDAGGQLWVTVVFIKGPPIAPSGPPPWSPFPSPEAFVEQQYRDFLGRPGDPAGVAHWAAQLRRGTANPAGEVDAFLGSPEFGGEMSPVVRLYFGAFARTPDQPGLQSWLDARRRGASLPAIGEAFAASAEFRARYDRHANRAFVDALYRTVFGRPADPGALNHWGGGLDSGRFTRGGVLVGVTGSGEFAWRSASEVSVTMAYVGLLRRTPDGNGFAYWVAQLDAGRARTDLLGSILASGEYAARF